MVNENKNLRIGEKQKWRNYIGQRKRSHDGWDPVRCVTRYSVRGCYVHTPRVTNDLGSYGVGFVQMKKL